MDPTESMFEGWLRGDIVQESKSSREWKIAQLGSGESMYNKDFNVIILRGSKW